MKHVLTLPDNLPENPQLFINIELLVEAIYKHCNLLAQTRRGGRLAVGAGQHSHVSPFLAQGLQLVAQLVKTRKHHVLHGFA